MWAKIRKEVWTAKLSFDRGLRRGPTSFRFENMWLKEEGFKIVLRLWWEGLNFRGFASFILSEKLKA